MKARHILLYIALIGLGVVVGVFIDHCHLPQATQLPPCPRLDPITPPELFQWSVPAFSLLSVHTNKDGGEVRTVRLTGLRTKVAARCAMKKMTAQNGYDIVSSFTNEAENILVAYSQRVVGGFHVDGERPIQVNEYGGPTNTLRAILDPSYVDLPEFGYYVSRDSGLVRTGILNSVLYEYNPNFWLSPGGTNIIQCEGDFCEDSDWSPKKFLFSGCLDNGRRVGTWYSMNYYGQSQEFWDPDQTDAVIRVSTGLQNENSASVQFEMRGIFKPLKPRHCLKMEWEKRSLRKIEMGQKDYPRHRITLLWDKTGKLEGIEAFVNNKPVCLVSNITADVWMPATLQHVLPPEPGKTFDEWF